MAIFDIIVLALIQGVTEFLPISSSGHLILWPMLTGRPDQGVTMDVAVHVGTLAAVCLYFRRDVRRLATGTAHLASGQVGTDDARLALLIAVATVPAVLVGFIMEVSGAIDSVRSVAVIGWSTILGGLLLWLGDRFGSERRDASGWSTRDALIMGISQAVALVPGVSRSGVTMTAARTLGFRRDESARLSLLMAVPIIIAAGAAEITRVIANGRFEIGGELVVGAVLSCLAAFATLGVMMRMFRTSWTMLPFVVYRLILGTGLLWLAYG